LGGIKIKQIKSLAGNGGGFFYVQIKIKRKKDFFSGENKKVIFFGENKKKIFFEKSACNEFGAVV